MHRIDTPGHLDGHFRDGDPQAGQQGTVMDAAWANDVQENIARVIEAAEDEDGEAYQLEKGNFDQLKLAIAAMIRDATPDWSGAIATAKAQAIAETRVPVGTIIKLDGPLSHPGYVPLDVELLRATYPDLVAYYVAQGRLIPGSTDAHFRTPNYHGLFDRATSLDAAVDPGGPRAPGSLQGDAFASHDHTLPVRDNADTGNGQVEDAGTGGSVRTASTGATGGAETRPKNVALGWFIKI